jgi:hypothetical protein
MFGPKRDDVTGECRKLHNEELHNLYSSPNSIRQIKLRQMRWAGHAAHMEEEKKVYKGLVESSKERYNSQDQGVDEITMDLRGIGRGALIGLEWLRIGTGGKLLCVR